MGSDAGVVGQRSWTLQSVYGGQAYRGARGVSQVTAATNQRAHHLIRFPHSTDEVSSRSKVRCKQTRDRLFAPALLKTLLPTSEHAFHSMAPGCKNPQRKLSRPPQALLNAESSGVPEEATRVREMPPAAPKLADVRSRGGEASTSGRQQRAPVIWRRKKEGEPLGSRAGLPSEVAETVTLLRRETDPELVKALLLRLERVSRGLVMVAFDEFVRQNHARCCIVVLRFILDQGTYYQEVKAVNKAINLLIRLKNWTAFDKLYEEIMEERVELDVAACNSLIKGFGLSGRPERAVAIVEYMRSVGLSPDAIAYHGLMTAYVRAGDVQRAMQLFDDMKADKVAPNAFHATVLLDAYTRSEDWLGALAFSCRMEEESIRPDKVLYQTLINLHCRQGNPTKAHELLKQVRIEGLSPSYLSCTKVLESLVKVGDGAAAEQVLELMCELKLRPTFTVYSQVIRAYTKGGDLTTAKAVLDRVVKEGVAIDVNSIAFGTISFLVRELVKTGDVATAESAIQQLRVACPAESAKVLDVLESIVNDSKLSLSRTS